MANCARCGVELDPRSRVCAGCGASAKPAAAASGGWTMPAAHLEAAAAGVPPRPAAPATAWHPTDATPGSGRIARIRFHLARAFGWDLRAVEVETEERERLVSLGVDEEDARRYLCWRRSVLKVVMWPTLISALLALLGTVTTDQSGLSGLGALLELIRLVALFALPVSAWLAAKAWDRHRRSRTLLLRGWLIAFLTPLVLALVPMAWHVDLTQADASIRGQTESALAWFGAIAVYVTLMPAVLSLIPGVLRACLRVKALLPESIIPGWFLVASTPLYVLLFLVIFSTVNQVAGDALLLVSVVALLGAPLLYMWNAGTFTRPLHSQEEVARIGQVQRVVGYATAVGIVLMLFWAFQAKIMGQYVIGVGESTSYVRPWDPNLFQFPIEYIARSLFTTVLVADLFMLINLSVWQHTKAFASSDRAQTYDRLMSEIEEAGGRD